jgi:hypothetical protein
VVEGCASLAKKISAFQVKTFLPWLDGSAMIPVKRYLHWRK